MQQSGSFVETISLVLIGLGCLLTVFGTVGTAMSVRGSGRVAVAGIALLVVGGVGIMSERGPQ